MEVDIGFTVKGFESEALMMKMDKLEPEMKKREEGTLNYPEVDPEIAKMDELETEMKKRKMWDEEGTVNCREVDPEILKMDELEAEMMKKKKKMMDEERALFKDYEAIAEGSCLVSIYSMDVESSIAHLKQVLASEGFEVDYFHIDHGGIIQPIQLYRCKSGYLRDLLDFLINRAVEHYNKKNKECTNIREPELMKVTRLYTGFFRYFITFEATDDAGDRNLYRARGEANPWLEKSEVTFCKFFKKGDSNSSYPDYGKIQELDVHELTKKYKPLVEGSWQLGPRDIDYEAWIEYMRQVVESEEGAKISDSDTPKLVKATQLKTGFFRYFIPFEAKDGTGERNLYRALVEESPDPDETEVTSCTLFKRAAA